MKKKTAVLWALLLVTPFLNARAEEMPSPPQDSRKISMDFDNAAVKDVLKILSQQSGLNFVSSEEIESKRITVYFDNVEVQDALESIMSANNLRYEQKEGSDIFVVHSAASDKRALVTRVYRLKYLRLSTSPLDISGRKTVLELTKLDIPNVAGGASDISSFSSTAAPVTGAAGAAETASGIDVLVSRLLSERGRLTLDAHTNSLIVTDTAEKQTDIAKVLEALDVPPSQVLLEVYVMEVKKDILSDIGIEWGGTDGEILSLTGATRTTEFPFSSGLFKKDLGLDIAANKVGTVTAGSINATNLSATLHFIKSQADTRVLAQPKILALNNEAAIIKLVTNAAVSANTTLTTSGNLTQSTTDVERAELGISLKMTPQINEDDDSIDLFLQPSVTTAQRNTFFTGNVILDPTTRIVRTMVRVENERTIVIGGLLDSNRTTTRRKLPLLGDVPIVGQAFSYDDRDDIDREILIFITPTIIRPKDEATKLGLNERNVAARRMLDAFRDREIDATLEPYWPFEKTWRRAEVSRKSKPAKTLSSAMEKEMSAALSAFEYKTTKTNR